MFQNERPQTFVPHQFVVDWASSCLTTLYCKAISGPYWVKVVRFNRLALFGQFTPVGQYDMVAIFEAPDDTTLAKAILSSTSEGSIKSETCRAFTEEEYRRIVGGLD